MRQPFKLKNVCARSIAVLGPEHTQGDLKRSNSASTAEASTRASLAHVIPELSCEPVNGEGRWPLGSTSKACEGVSEDFEGTVA